MKRDDDRRRNWLLIAYTLLLVGIGVLVLAHTLWLAHLRGQVDDHLDAWRARGLPATPYELKEWASVPVSGANAADLYDKAFGLMVPRLEWSEPVWEFRRDDLHAVGDEGVQAARTLVAAYREPLKLLRQASGMESYRRPLNIEGHVIGSMPTVQNALHACRILRIDGRLALLDRDFQLVENDLRTLRHLSRSMSTEPTLIAQQVSFASESIAMALLQDAFNLGNLPREHAFSMSAIFDESDDSPACLARGFIGEVCVLNYLFDAQLYEILSRYAPFDTKYDFPNQAAMFLYTLLGIPDFEHLQLLKIEIALYDALIVPPHDLPSRLGAIETEIADLPPFCLLTRDLAGGLVEACYTALDQLAMVRNARVVLAVQGYIADHGRPPKDLGELVPDYLANLPSDPYTGKSLLYDVDKTGYAVYSTGRDRMDDGGKETRVRGTARAGEDVTFRVRIPPPREEDRTSQ